VGRHAPKKEKKHTAMSDIRESLRELTYYKRKLFNNKS
jgi:oligoribonuclease (3'-5' exoribonuclease)